MQRCHAANSHHGVGGQANGSPTVTYDEVAAATPGASYALRRAAMAGARSRPT